MNRMMYLLCLLSISLMLYACGGDNTESEANNSFDTADKIDLGKQLKGSIEKIKDVDFFTFTAKQAGVLEIAVTNLPDKTNTVVRVYNNHKKKVIQFSEKNGRSLIADRLISPGKYYVQLDCNRKSLDNHGQYILTLGYDTTDTNELNNSFDKATPIKLGTSTKGSIRSVGDKDFYKFEVPKPCVVSMRITSVPDTIDMGMKIYDLDKKRLGVFHEGNGRSLMQEALLWRKSYYLELYDGGSNKSSSQLYQLELVADMSDTYEMNQSFSTATPIKLDDTIKASLNPVNDVDVYKFSLKQDNNTKISLIPSNAALRPTMTLYDTHKRKIKAYHVKNGKSLGPTISLKTGSYYIQLQNHNKRTKGANPYEMKVSLTAEQ